LDNGKKRKHERVKKRLGKVTSLPRDNFRRERERRIRSAIEFDNLYRKITRRDPSPSRRVIGCDQMEQNNSLMEVSSQKTFHCTNCGQVIVTTSEDRAKRARVSCLRCNEKYKLHPPYVTHEGETIQYEEQ
jgi:hypothetical protein